MAHFIDRRLNSKGKSTVNRQRFIRRYKSQIKKAVSDSISGRSVTDIDSGEEVSIPTRDISEPVFHTGRGGKREMVHPGNDQFITGDKIQRPPGGAGGGSGQGEASNQGEGEEDFTFAITREEFLNYLFDDLALPNMVKQSLARTKNFKTRRAGFVSEGTPNNLSVVKSMRNAHARRIGMGAGKRRNYLVLF